MSKQQNDPVGEALNNAMFIFREHGFDIWNSNYQSLKQAIAIHKQERRVLDAVQNYLDQFPAVSITLLRIAKRDLDALVEGKK